MSLIIIKCDVNLMQTIFQNFISMLSISLARDYLLIKASLGLLVCNLCFFFGSFETNGNKNLFRMGVWLVPMFVFILFLL